MDTLFKKLNKKYMAVPFFIIMTGGYIIDIIICAYIATSNINLFFSFIYIGVVDYFFARKTKDNFLSNVFLTKTLLSFSLFSILYFPAQMIYLLITDYFKYNIGNIHKLLALILICILYFIQQIILKYLLIFTYIKYINSSGTNCKCGAGSTNTHPATNDKQNKE